jgi:hypothetical protein
MAHGAKKACTEPADQRCDYDCGKERDELGAYKIWINCEPQGRGNHNGHEGEGEGVGSDRSRQQRGDIDAK